MARTRSTYTASPTRTRSPQRSPARRPSNDGSEYEMDLDALGLNSTFESTELQASYEPPVDRIDTSAIEGPEDFTMNMTYWMTADLPLAQIKSRKEAKGTYQEARMDILHATEESHKVVVENELRNRQSEDQQTASPSRRANQTSEERTYSTPASERSMENDEKVRSFLSALPDTDMEGALAGTPLHVPKQSLLQIPRSSPGKSRSLQPTVEDHDTPRKPTQETVIHHTSAVLEVNEHDALLDQIASLQSQLRQQELTSKTRITELETILAYTRTDLEETRSDSYKQKDKINHLEKSIDQQHTEGRAALEEVNSRFKAKEEALDSKMQEFGEEMRLQSEAKLHNQRDSFEEKIRALTQSKRLTEEGLATKDQMLDQVRVELSKLQDSNEKLRQEKAAQQNGSRDAGLKDGSNLSDQLSAVLSRADTLQEQLHRATREATATRERAEKNDAARNAIETKARALTSRISDLETNLQTVKFELECTQADAAAKQQLFQTNIDLSERIRVQKSDLERARNTSKNEVVDDERTTELASQVRTLKSQLESFRIEKQMRDQEAARHFEPKIPSDQHVNAAQGRSEGLTTEWTSQVRKLESQLESMRIEKQSRDQEALRHIELQDLSEQRLHAVQGRTEGLERSLATFRQQLSEAHRDTARVRKESERYEQDLEDANERLQEARAEADRRVADVEKRLSKVKESKTETEQRWKEMQAQHDDLVEGHEAMLEDIRDKAEDAVRKAGALLEQERTEKRRLAKELKRTKAELEKVQSEAAQRVTEEDSSDDEGSTSISQGASNEEKDIEIARLSTVLRKQHTEIKKYRSTVTRLTTTLENSSDVNSTVQTTISQLESRLTALQTTNTTLETRLQTQEEEFEAINKAMDEKLATLLSKLMKERAKTVVGKRDDQWQESVRGVQGERELLGKMLLRQWGREEVCVADERRGEKQQYEYKYVKRERT